MSWAGASWRQKRQIQRVLQPLDLDESDLRSLHGKFRAFGIGIAGMGDATFGKKP